MSAETSITDQIDATIRDFRSQKIVRTAEESFVDVSDVASKHKNVIIWTLIGSGIFLTILIIILIIYHAMK